MKNKKDRVIEQLNDLLQAHEDFHIGVSNPDILGDNPTNEIRHLGRQFRKKRQDFIDQICELDSKKEVIEEALRVLSDEDIQSMVYEWVSDPANSEWVSVEDRLPEEGEAVLIYHKNGGYNLAVFQKARTWKGKQLKFVMFKSRGFYADDVTHWRTLSPPIK